MKKCTVVTKISHQFQTNISRKCGEHVSLISNVVHFSGWFVVINAPWFFPVNVTYCCVGFRFAVCDQCILIEDNLKKSAKDPSQLKVWQEAKKIHREYVRKSPFV